MAQLKNRKAQSLTELLVSSALVITLISSTLGAFILVKQVFVRDIVEANLQRDANVIMKKLIKGEREAGVIFRLSEAVSYSIVINGMTGVTELHFMSPSPDTNDRWYYLNAAGTSVLYHHPGFPVNDEVIYTAPQGAVITLRFWTPPGSMFTNIAVGIDVAVSQNMSGKNVSGSVTTIVNIRNHFV
jgi:hypothetical protein